MIKQCTCCGRIKAYADFYLKNTSGRLSSACKECDKDRAWRFKLKNAYNMTEEQYNEIHEYQQYGCAICGKPEGENNRRTRLTVDHCHTTGVVRGLLCHNCNSALGLLGDDTDRFERAIIYLRESKSEFTCR